MLGFLFGWIWVSKHTAIFCDIGQFFEEKEYIDKVLVFEGFERFQDIYDFLEIEFVPWRIS